MLEREKKPSSPLVSGFERILAIVFPRYALSLMVAREVRSMGKSSLPELFSDWEDKAVDFVQSLRYLVLKNSETTRAKLENILGLKSPMADQVLRSFNADSFRKVEEGLGSYGDRRFIDFYYHLPPEDEHNLNILTSRIDIQNQLFSGLIYNLDNIAGEEQLLFFPTAGLIPERVSEPVLEAIARQLSFLTMGTDPSVDKGELESAHCQVLGGERNALMLTQQWLSWERGKAKRWKEITIFELLINDVQETGCVVYATSRAKQQRFPVVH
ncbi:hypothetical protein KBC79_04355 [Candidatus Woesebacteria bacterium]|nr:hypothetical protein [Candidatus Woesebacteria bacterium]